MVHEAKMLTGTLAFASVWGALRWSIRRGGVNPETLKVRVPITVAAVLGLVMVSQGESYLVGHKDKNDFERYVVQPAVTLVGSTLLWAAFTVAPYSIFPTIAVSLSEIALKAAGSSDPAGDAAWDTVNKKQ